MCYRKYIFVLLFIILIVYPLPALSTDSRGFDTKPTSFSPIAHLGNYHALIIGINKYEEWNPLRTAVKDAEALKYILIRRYGFKKENVILRTDIDAKRLRLLNDLRNIVANLSKQDNLLIYFAGHGQLDDLTGDGYWIPVEGKLKDPGTWISHSTLKNILSSEKVRGKNIVVVADSCYSGTLLRGGPSLLSINEQGYRGKLLQLASNRSRQVITSGGLEPVADGGRDGHSLFAYYFLKALKDNERDLIDLENLFHTRVWKYVTEIGGQRPNIGRLKTPMDEDGQFVLTLQTHAIESLNHLNEKHEQEQRGSERYEMETDTKNLKTDHGRIETDKTTNIIVKHSSNKPQSKPVSVSHTTSVRTKMFYKDLQRCSNFIDEQFNVLMEFFNALTKEDVNILNDSSGYGDVEIFNSKALSAFKKLTKMDRYYPKGVKHSNNQSAGIPRNFLGGYIHGIGDYWNVIVDSYKIPTEDYFEVLNNYSEYLINLLDKLQELRVKQNKIELRVSRLPKINDIFLTQGNINITFLGKPIMFDIVESLRSNVLSSWKASVIKLPELYSNKNVLTTQKLWLKFVFDNDIVITKWGDSYEEEYITEIDKVEKRLVNLSGASVQKEKPSDKLTDTTP